MECLLEWRVVPSAEAGFYIVLSEESEQVRAESLGSRVLRRAKRQADYFALKAKRQSRAKGAWRMVTFDSKC